MATQAERRATTRAAIIEAASAEFAAAGSPDVALDVIAERAGVTKGSIQYHFANRAGLLGEVATWIFAELERRVAALGDDVTPREYLRVILAEQAGPTGRVLFTIGDELARSGTLQPFDPYPYLCERLDELGLGGPVSVTAAATVQFGRHLAFGLVDADGIEGMLDDLLGAGGS
ncbi:MAG: TetR/AcrR family transcriptional regulator [Actinomycetota bacterium]